jgi:hypothetical protein
MQVEIIIIIIIIINHGLEERKQAFSERMKAFWNNKRNPKKS